MTNTRQSMVLFSLLLLCLLIQVGFSAVIVRRLHENDRTLINMNDRLDLIIESSQPESFTYIEGVSIDDDPQRGTENAPVTLIEFSDYECPACAQAQNNLRRLLSDYEGQILHVFRDFPLEGHAHALRAAEAANCAGEQGSYWEMHDMLFDNQSFLDDNNLINYALRLELNTPLFNACLEEGKYTDEILHDLEQGLKYQVVGTPTYFVNGYRVVGGSLDALRAAIELTLNK